MSNAPRSSVQNTNLSNLKAAYFRYMYHWPLFVLALILAFSAGWFYLRLTDRVYEINASLLVRDEKKSPQEKSAIEELNQQGSPNNAETEIQILTSKRLISGVVNELQLWATYTSVQDLKVTDLYGQEPFKLHVVSPPVKPLKKYKLTILIRSTGSFEVRNSKELSGNYQFGQEINSSFGKWKLEPSATLDQYIGEEIVVDINDPVVVANTYLKKLDVHLLDKSAPTIGLSITDKLQQRGKDILNSIIKDYNETTSAEEKRKTANTIVFLKKRLSSLKSELDQAEKQVEGFRTREGITDIESQSKVYLENVQANDSKMNDVNVQLSVIEGIERYVNSSANLETAPVLSGVGNEALTEQIENLAKLQLDRVALLATTPERNPIFEPINRQISNTKASIKSSVQRIKSSLQSTKNKLNSFNNKFESSIRKIPGQERQFIDMKRQQSIKENLYIYLLQKKEELELSNASTLVDARIVDNANLGQIKWPRPSLVYTIALLVGLGIPFMLLYFRQSFNNRILSTNDIKRALALPIIAHISEASGGIKTILESRLGNLLTEQFRTLRVNLDHLYKNSDDETANLSPALQIHHDSSAAAKHPPLYIIDGDKSNLSEFNSLLYADIKNISFLNDESYVGEYGEDALHGVVEVTTKQPKDFTNHSSATLVKEQTAKKQKDAKERSDNTNSVKIATPKGHVTLVTSSTSNEGKSFVISNLAVEMAASQRKTVLIDMNFHKPSIAEIFNLKTSHSGLTNFLSGELDMDAIIQRLDSHPNLDIITRGDLGGQSVGLLEQDKLGKLVTTLKKSYDEILIDSPPIHLVTDAVIIAELADVTLYVIKQNYTSKTEFDFIRQIDEDGKLPEMNIVFNGIVDGKYGDSYDRSYYTSNSSERGFFNLFKFLGRRM